MLIVLSSCSADIPPSSDSIANAFCIDDQIYYITQSGTLYTHGQDDAVFAFPTHLIVWSDNYNAFLYLHGDTLCTYNLNSGTVNEMYKFNIDTKDNYADYVIYTYGNIAYICSGKECFAFDFKTQECISINNNIKNIIAAKENSIIYTATNNRDIYILDISSGNTLQLSTKSSDSPIVSACIYNNALLYTCGDGKLSGVSLNGEPCNDFPNISNHIVSLATFGDRLFCAVSQTNNNSKHVSSLYEIKADGTLKETSSFEAVAWIVPASCKLHIFNHNYIFYVTTSDQVMVGTVH